MSAECPASERWFRALIERSSDITLVVGADATLRYVSPAAWVLFGYQPDGLVGTSPFDLIHPDDHELVAQTLLDLTAEPLGAVGPRVRYRLRHADGTWRWIETVGTNFLADPAVNGVVVNCHDVTEQVNVGRTLRTLSLGNNVLVRSTDEASLLSELCRTIVEAGAYQLAWVGYAETDAAHSVTPVASAGCTGYLTGLRVGWGEDQYGQGPAGTAIRTGETQVVDDVRGRRTFAPWSGAAERHGLRTICALPLTAGDDKIGVLVIYSREPGTFDQAAVALLTELADALTYGIGRLRDRARVERSEAQLLEAERLAHVGHWEWTPDSDRVEFLAEEMFRIQGTTKDAWAGTLDAFLAFVPADDRSAVADAFEQARRGEVAEVDHRIIRPDGQVRYVRKKIQPVKGPDGELRRVIGVSFDITDQTVARQELERSQQFLLAVTDTMVEGLLASDDAGRITLANTAALRMLGLSADALIGHRGHPLIHYRRADGTPRPAEECPIRGVRESGTEVHVERDVFIRSDGTTLPVSYSAAPLRTPGLHGSVVVFEDTTEREAERARLEQALGAATEAVRTKSAFVANMSHEIRTPMNGVMGMLSLLLECDLSPVERDYAETMATSTEALMGVINNILDFSKLDAGRLEPDREEFVVRGPVEAAIAGIAGTAQQKGLELVSSVAADVPERIVGDRLRVRQILVNLLDNAVKFTAEGDVVLRVSVDGSDRLRFEVSDTGIGIEPEGAHRLFEAFTQGDASTTRKFGGSGLGLAICKQLVELMGGQIGVESEPGVGSTFWFTLPFEVASASTDQSGAAPLRGERILVVSGHAVGRSALVDQLRQWQPDLVSIAEPDEAASRLRDAAAAAAPFDVAILDDRLGGGSQIALANAISADPTLASLRIAALSVPARIVVSAKAVDTWVSKPVRSAPLLAALTQVLTPAAEAPAMPSSLPASRTPTTAKCPVAHATVLVAEDNATNAKVAVAMLAAGGYQADIATDGVEVLDMLARRKYDAVLMDVQMPRLNGYDTTKAIRERGLLDLPVIAVTASAMESDRIASTEAGMDDFISKPIERDALLETLEKWLKAPRRC